MAFTMAVCSGPDAAAELELATRSPGVVLRTHQDHAVAWADDCPWVSTRDDGEVLVVVDGRLHEPPTEGTTPAEVLHDRYRSVGEDLARGVLGDFVAVVLDRRRRTLLVSRDPVGVRPWYQGHSGTRHAGATDVASLLRLPWVSQEVDEDTALAFLAGRAESRGPTFHEGVSTLAPGRTWRLRFGDPSSWAHFAWQIDPEPGISWTDAVDRCRELLDEAVRCRIRALGGAASELSGGLDSSAVVGTAVLLGDTGIVAGRLLFDGPSADERGYSTAVAEQWGLEAVSTPPTILSLDGLRALSGRLRRPAPDPNFLMFRDLHRELAARGHTGVLTGLGGDDAFVDTGLENRLISALQQRRRDVLAPLLATAVRRPKAAWEGTVRPTLRSLLPRSRRRPPAYIPPAVAAAHGLISRCAEPAPRLTGVRSIDVRAGGLTSGHVSANLEDAAVVEDLSGIRRSHPFLDPRFITGTYGLDPWFPVRDGHYRALQAAAYSDRVPASVANRQTKAEFSEVVWPVSLQPDVVDRITSGPLAERGWLDPVGFRNVLADARSGRSHAALPMARMTALDEWLRTIDR